MYLLIPIYVWRPWAQKKHCCGIALSMMKMKMESCHVISLARSVLLLLGETGRCARCALEMCAGDVRQTRCALPNFSRLQALVGLSDVPRYHSSTILLWYRASSGSLTCLQQVDLAPLNSTNTMNSTVSSHIKILTISAKTYLVAQLYFLEKYCLAMCQVKT